MQNNRVLRALSQVWRILLGIVALLGLVAWLQSHYNLSLLELVGLFSALGIGVMVYLLVVAGGHLAAIEKKLDTGFSELDKKLEERTSQAQKNTNPNKNPGNNPGNPYPSSYEKPKIPTEREPEPKPSGGGAFAGMVIGGALGAAAGPVGVIVAGIIGALIGNQIEYDNVQKRKGGK